MNEKNSGATSSDDESSDCKQSSKKIFKKHKRRHTVKKEQSSSSENETKRIKNSKKHKKRKKSSEDSSDNDSTGSENKYLSRKHKYHYKKKHKQTKRYSSDSTSNIKISKKEKLKKRKKAKSSSDVSSEEDEEHTEIITHKQLHSSDESDAPTADFKNCQEECQDTSFQSNSSTLKLTENGVTNIESANGIVQEEMQDHMSLQELPEECQEDQQSPKDNKSNDEDKVEENINVAIQILNTTVSDIKELSIIISDEAKRFGKKKISVDSLHSYEDVLNVLSRLKGLMFGVHENYSQIEQTFEESFNPWKIAVGLEKPETIATQEEDTVLDNEQHIAETDEVTSGENIIKNSEAGEQKEACDEIVNSVEVASMDIISKSNHTNTEIDEKLDGIATESGGEITDGTIIAESDKLVDKTKIDESNDLENQQDTSENKTNNGGEVDFDKKNNLDKDINNASLLEDKESDINKAHIKTSNEEEINKPSDDPADLQHENSTIICSEDKGEENKNSDSCLEKKNEETVSEQNIHGGKSLDDKNFEALQEMLGTSSEDEEQQSGSSDSDDSDDIHLDDSELEDILKVSSLLRSAIINIRGQFFK